MVSFHDCPETYQDAAMLQLLDSELKKCVQLDEKLRAMDQEIAVNPQYVRKSSGMQEDELASTVMGGKLGPFVPQGLDVPLQPSRDQPKSGASNAKPWA
ncbi:PREDICTED: COP9 signalosome complex subunit 3-like [Priapulus caudatus]|uniref:COP9 signalosome complex subunit 3-like n=1 Tax=Priapulus caudatus TaxID=37621 RepID=A0ABM1F500_PRICU|nr:PREDICTED: COP9 signalosome complex subunit 3-like [Priapulus caudatus]